MTNEDQPDQHPFGKLTRIVLRNAVESTRISNKIFLSVQIAEEYLFGSIYLHQRLYQYYLVVVGRGSSIIVNHLNDFNSFIHHHYGRLTSPPAVVNPCLFFCV